MTDEKYIARCLEIALEGKLTVAPNPMVGCVIVHNNKIVAEGYHKKFGEAHAEVNAFSSLADNIPSTECDVYVNLEPCSFYGKTPPCANLLVEKKPKKVVIGTLDPHTKVAGKGIKLLLEAGIEVKVGVLEAECKSLNKVFFKAHTQRSPYVTLKWAETKNGYMARHLDDLGVAKISSPQNDLFVHQLRASHQAILIGASTANRDNPLLNVRLLAGNNPTKVILSPTNSLHTKLKLFKEGKTLVYSKMIEKKYDRIAEHIVLSSFTIKAVLDDLYNRNIHSVLVEGGPTILSLFLKEQLWDEAIILKSNDSWLDGVKAPWIGKPSTSEIIKGNDIIKFFET